MTAPTSANGAIAFPELQRVFDIVAAHLLRQNARAVGMADQCMYRAPNGLMCAVGVLIPSEKYVRECEGSSVVQLMAADRLAIDLAALSNKNYEQMKYMLYRLQSMHDAGLVELWPMRLKKIAEDFGLALPECLRAAPAAS